MKMLIFQNLHRSVDQREPWQKMPKFNMKVVIPISFGFFAFLRSGLIYDGQLPYILKTLLPGQYFLIGFLMTINNIAWFFI